MRMASNFCRTSHRAAWRRRESPTYVNVSLQLGAPQANGAFGGGRGEGKALRTLKGDSGGAKKVAIGGESH